MVLDLDKPEAWTYRKSPTRARPNPCRGCPPNEPVDGAYTPRMNTSPVAEGSRMNTSPVAEGSRNTTMSEQVWGWLSRCRERGMSDAQRDYGLDRIRERFRMSGLPDAEIENCIGHTMRKLGL